MYMEESVQQNSVWCLSECPNHNRALAWCVFHMWQQFNLQNHNNRWDKHWNGVTWRGGGVEGDFQLKLWWNMSAHQCIPVNKEPLHLPYLRHPSKRGQPPSLVIYGMDWPSRACQVCPPTPDLSCGINMRCNHASGQVAPSPSVCPFWFLNPFSVVVVFVFWVLYVRGVKCLQEVSPGGSSWLHNFLPSLYGCCHLGNCLFFLLTFNQVLTAYLRCWWYKK